MMQPPHLTKIPIATIKEFLPRGSTKPFVAFSDLNKKYVVKALRDQSKNGQLLLNEFVAGVLANQINLPWPRTFIAILSDKAMRWLENNSFDIATPDCVAIEFIEGLTDVPGEFEANPSHLSKYFSNPSAQSVFYGRALLELWLFFTDTTSDTLHAKSDNTPIFLDGSHILHVDTDTRQSEDSNLCNLKYSSSTNLSSSPYLEGILTHPELFEEWLDKIKSIENIFIRSMLDSVPKSWGISKQQSECLYDLLTIKKKEFLKTARQRIEWDAYNRRD